MIWTEYPSLEPHENKIGNLNLAFAQQMTLRRRLVEQNQIRINSYFVQHGSSSETGSKGACGLALRVRSESLASTLGVLLRRVKVVQCFAHLWYLGRLSTQVCRSEFFARSLVVPAGAVPYGKYILTYLGTEILAHFLAKDVAEQVINHIYLSSLSEVPFPNFIHTTSSYSFHFLPEPFLSTIRRCVHRASPFMKSRQVHGVSNPEGV